MNDYASWDSNWADDEMGLGVGLDDLGVDERRGVYVLD